MKTPQEILPFYFCAASTEIQNNIVLAMEEYAAQFKNKAPDAGKQFDFPEHTPEAGTRVLALTTSQGWQILHRGYSSYEEEPIWIFSATSERAYLNVIKWQHLPPLT